MTFEELFDKYEGEVEVRAQETPPEGLEGTQNASEDEGGNSTAQDDLSPALLAKFFNLNEYEVGRVKDKLRTIFDYARAHDEDVMGYLVGLEGRLGDPKYGVSKLDHFYQYVKVLGEADKVISKLKTYGNTDSSNGQGGDSSNDTTGYAGGGDAA